LFIDQIRASQTHKGRHRVFSDGLVAHLDANGDIERTSLKSVKHQGSYSTTIQIRSDGQRVNVSGNVGRFNRPDNVFNYDLESTMAITNSILESLDIPPFTAGKREYYSYKNKSGETVDAIEYTGATFSEIHCTQNYSTGSVQAMQDFCHNVSMVKPSRQNVKSYPTGCTYGEGSSFKASKIYSKSEDLKRLIKIEKLTKTDYITNLIKYCEEQGMVRAEIQYRDYLRREGLSFWGEVTHDDLLKHFKKDENVMIKNTEIFNVDEISRTYRTTYYDYINGVNLRNRMSSTSFYKHRKELLKYGIDIAVTLNVQRLPVQTKVIEIKPCITPPSFYHMPEIKAVRHLKSA